jgi:murein DD-endopeptidase MepM/ murein hydrolase activator NlpD
MLKELFIAVLCGSAMAGQIRAQEVIVAREAKPNPTERVASVSEGTDSESETATGMKSQVHEKKSASTALTVEEMRMAGAVAAERQKNQARLEQTSTTRGPNLPAAKAGALAERQKKETQTTKSEGAAAPVRPTMIESGKQEPTASQPAKAEVRGGQTSGPQSVNRSLRKQEATVSQLVDKPTREPDAIPAQSISTRAETAFTKLANGFDFPIGAPDAQGYYKARGFRSYGHLGEDWDGVRGGDTDLGDPIYSIGDGLVVFARDCHMGWGNVIIVRHAYRENGAIRNIDSLYGHLDSILVHRGQAVSRGQKIATMGTAHGLYDAHLHLEIRKNIEIGMSRAAFARDFSNYYDPSQFILSHRHLQTSWGKYRIAMNTFTHDALINWDTARNYSHHRGGTGESAAALAKALASEP